MDHPEQEDLGMAASFTTSGDVPDELAWGLIAELVAGKRMIAQIGDLPLVTFNLDTAKPDIVEFLFGEDPLPTGTIHLGFHSGASQQLRLLEWNQYFVRLDLPDGATAFVDRLVTARSMTLDSSDFPTLRFDLARGRPEIADFRAKCRTLLGAVGSGS